MEDQDNINEHLKARLEEFKLNPRMTSFDEIQKKMKKKKRRGFFFFLIPGIFLVLGLTGYFSFIKEVSIQKPLADKNTERFETERPASLSGSEQMEGLKRNKLPEKISKNNRLNSEKMKQNTETLFSGENKKNKRSVNKLSAPEQTIKPSKEISGQKSFVSQSISVAKKKRRQQEAKESSHASLSDTENLSYNNREGGTEKFENAEILPITTEAMLLKTMPLIYPGVAQSMRVDSLKEIALNRNDSIIKEKKLNFFVGLTFNPQLGAYLFTQQKVSAFEKEVSDAYLKAVKSENVPLFNYGCGLKAGILINQKWEVLVGFGFQRYIQKSKAVLIPVSSFTNQSTAIPSTYVSNTNNAADPNAVYKSTFNYYDFSAEIARYRTFNRFFKIKFGLGLHAQKLSGRSQLFSDEKAVATAQYDGYSLYTPQQLKKWIGNVNLKAGLIEDLTKNIQFQACPNVFYSPTSMLTKANYLKQNNYGFGLECLLLFRLR